MNRVVEVRAPCRLHFGMFGFGNPAQREHGGVGAMIDEPGVVVTIARAQQFAAVGPFAERARQVVERLAAEWKLAALPSCEVKICAPRDHTGLGVGTQLALAVGAGLRRFSRLTELSVEELAICAGRGARSAVGTHGFRLGGL